MGNIQHHIDWNEKQRNWAIDYNAMVAQCREGMFDLFDKSMETVTNQEYKEKRLEEILANGFREVPELIPQVTLDQVKEKFGTLRFYYTGGDEYISGLVSMAESMSGVTCEECSAPAETRGPGWIRTICNPCEEARELARKQSDEEWQQRKLLKEGFEE
jgi:hypothetical protein